MTISVIQGGCLCGAVRYEASEPPFWRVIATAKKNCRKHTGAAFAADAIMSSVTRNLLNK